MVTNTTVPTELAETGEKRDRIGRKITPRQRRAELVAAWQGSGLTQAEFARREGIIYSSFAAWVQASRRSGKSRRRGLPAVRFVEAKLPVSGPASSVTLEVRRPTARWCAAPMGTSWRHSCGHSGAEPMLAFPGGVRIYVAVQPVDMRKQFNGLWAAAQDQLGEAREFARSLGFRRMPEWRAWSKTPARPVDIPANPEKTYSTKWIGWRDWLRAPYRRPDHANDGAR